MVTVGIDPHKKTHTAVAVDQSGRQLGKPLTVDDDPQAVAKLLAWAHKLAQGETVGWAIEDGRGLARRLATALVATGALAVWVPVRLMVAERHHTGPRGKSDPLDAYAVAKACLNPDNAAYLAPVRTDEPGRELAWLVDERRDRLADRTRLINTLRWRLHELGPDLEPANLTSKIAPRRLADRLAKLPATLLRDLAIDACRDLARLTDRITQLEQEIDQRTTHLCPTLRARTGVGPVVAGTILAELGDPTRIRDGAALARLAGTAPIPVWTGNHERHRLDRGGNRHLNAAIHTIAITQTRVHHQAQTLITKHQQNKGKRGALRVLKRHLNAAIWRDLQTDLATLTSRHATI